MDYLDSVTLFNQLKNFIQNNCVKDYRTRHNLNTKLLLDAVSYPTLIEMDCDFYYVCSCADHKVYFDSGQETYKRIPILTYGDRFDVEGLYFIVVKNKEIISVNHLIKY